MTRKLNQMQPNIIKADYRTYLIGQVIHNVIGLSAAAVQSELQDERKSDNDNKSNNTNGLMGTGTNLSECVDLYGICLFG
jgi:hypothetical protein